MPDNFPPSGMGRYEVPSVVVERLPQYVRALSQLLDAGVSVANSQQLGARLQITPAQIRKDLSYFGRFGKQGQGYPVAQLLAELKQILGLTGRWNVAVVGVGRLGRAILNYPGFTPDGFQLVAALDANPDTIGQTVGGLVVDSVDDLAAVVRQRQISIAIVAVPVAHTQAVIDQAAAGGIRAILNYAPLAPQTPPGVHIRSIDPALSLQAMTYYLANDSGRTGRAIAS